MATTFDQASRRAPIAAVAGMTIPALDLRSPASGSTDTRTRSCSIWIGVFSATYCLSTCLRPICDLPATTRDYLVTRRTTTTKTAKPTTAPATLRMLSVRGLPCASTKCALMPAISRRTMVLGLARYASWSIVAARRCRVASMSLSIDSGARCPLVSTLATVFSLQYEHGRAGVATRQGPDGRRTVPEKVTRRETHERPGDRSRTAVPGDARTSVRRR